MKWCLAAANSSGEGTAVPICISLKNCRLSQEIISQLKCFAKVMLKDVFPMAVGPIIVIKYFIF
jgi:hypothetical protein